MSEINHSRRNFFKASGALLLGSTLPISLVELAFADADQNFTFAYISDAHIQHISGSRFVRNWDQGLKRAVAEVNLLTPKPDFVMFGGDLAQLGSKPELDHGAEIMSALSPKTHYVMGEHDYYLDLGEYWENLFGPQFYSFDHKGVHFIVLNSIRTYDEWTYKRWPTAEQRMLEMAGLDNPNGSPFMVGEKQRQWLKADLAKVSKGTPVVVFSHSPLQKIYKGWNFWTEDAEQIQALLKPFKKVSVIYGHVHQIQYNQIGNISFNSVMATAWPWPYPASYAQAEQYLPKLTVPMNRADPFFERDATGWQFINMASGDVDLNFTLYNNKERVVRFDKAKKSPVDSVYQPEKIPYSSAKPLLTKERRMFRQLSKPTIKAWLLAGFILPFAADADEFNKADLDRWQQQFMDTVKQGRELWTSPKLGTNGVACAQCHPNAANTHPETYPKFQKQLGKVVPIWEMINWCLRNPLEGQPLAADDPKMIAIQAYVTYERRGVKLEPGKH